VGGDRAPITAAQPPKTKVRSVVNALLYMVRTGCQWRQLPREFPPYTTVQNYFYGWRDGGVLERINFELLLQTREVAGREPGPSAGVVDNRSKPLKPAARAILMRRRRSKAASGVCHEHTDRVVEVWGCMRDEGRPLEVGSQVQASNRCKLRPSRATVVLCQEDA
jgi:transposase